MNLASLKQSNGAVGAAIINKLAPLRPLTKVQAIAGLDGSHRGKAHDIVNEALCGTKVYSLMLAVYVTLPLASASIHSVCC